MGREPSLVGCKLAIVGADIAFPRVPTLLPLSLVVHSERRGWPGDDPLPLAILGEVFLRTPWLCEHCLRWEREASPEDDELACPTLGRTTTWERMVSGVEGLRAGDTLPLADGT